MGERGGGVGGHSKNNELEGRPFLFKNHYVDPIIP